ncbi:MAG: PspA/IM30 family protein [Chloroflexi bacterium]|nr:PspA/IM30 family protein [Chloroflexota bacterium]
MGLLSRTTTVVKAKISKLLDRAEDPREILDYSYEKQLELLRNVKRGIIEVTTAKRRLEMQEQQIEQNMAKADDQARRAVAAGRDDLARIILQRKMDAQAQLPGIQQQIEGLAAQEQKLAGSAERLQTKIEAFRSQKEVVKAQYSAAEAQVKIGEAFSGVSEEMADVGLALDRAQDKTQRLQARAGAIDQLVDEGVLSDITGSEDKVEAELAKIGTQQNVEIELQSLKQQLGRGQEPKQLGAGQ